MSTPTKICKNCQQTGSFCGICDVSTYGRSRHYERVGGGMLETEARHWASAVCCCHTSSLAVCPAPFLQAAVTGYCPAPFLQAAVTGYAVCPAPFLQAAVTGYAVCPAPFLQAAVTGYAVQEALELFRHLSTRVVSALPKVCPNRPKVSQRPPKGLPKSPSSLTAPSQRSAQIALKSHSALPNRPEVSQCTLNGLPKSP